MEYQTTVNFMVVIYKTFVCIFDFRTNTSYYKSWNNGSYNGEIKELFHISNLSVRLSLKLGVLPNLKHNNTDNYDNDDSTDNYENSETTKSIVH